ncbi:MAG: IS481 family transposase, partial [Pseudacidovorax sp.]|uniref:leucine zipper domain-containing protein n=1 Tax=Pseudacidovorax sp. TaxID=1934311 RepID=UPI001B52289C
MNSHKNARLTFEGRKLLVQRIAVQGLQRFEQHGERGLLDRSSRPARTRSCLDAQLCERIEQLRRCR